MNPLRRHHSWRRSILLWALGLMSGTSVDGVDVALIDTDGERVLLLRGPTLRPVAYADEVRRMIRAAFGADRPNEATARPNGPHRGACRRRCAMVGGARRSAGDRSTSSASTARRARTARKGASPGRSATARCSARSLGVRVVNDFRARRRGGGRAGRAARAGLPCALWRASARRPLAVSTSAASPTSPGSAEGDVAARLRHGPRQRADRRLVRAAHRPRFDRDGALAASGKVDRTRARALVRASLLRAQSRRSRSTAATSTTAWADGLSVADGAATLTAPPRARSRSRPATFPAPAKQWLVTGGGARNPPYGAPSPRRRAARCVPAVDSAGTATRSRRRPSPSLRCARCAACRSPIRRRPACASL